ncbi:MAG: serine hydrolase domain-containing protein [Devosia sp.]
MAVRTAGFSADRLALLDRVLKERYVDAGLLPGTLIQIWRRGELAHTALCGVVDTERQKPMHEDAIFRIYSMTKPVVGVALLILMEEARIALRDEVARYVPQFADLRVMTGGSVGAWETAPLKRPMRIIDLATNTSGFVGAGDTLLCRVYAEQRIGDTETAGGLEAMVAQLAKLPLEFSPGERWAYGDVSTNVLGYIIETVSGMSLGAFLRSRIFEPLGMSDTGFSCPPEKLPRFASLYYAKGETFAFDAKDAMGRSPPKLESGAGGLVSTASDYMRFCRMLLGSGSLEGTQIIAPKSAAMMRTNYLPGGRDMADLGGARFAGWNLGGEGQSICAGTTINPVERLIPASAGDIFWAGAACTHFWVDPSEDLAAIFMAQVFDSPAFRAISGQFRTLVYSAMTESGARRT